MTMGFPPISQGKLNAFTTGYFGRTKNDYRFVMMIDDNRIMMSQVFGFFLQDLSKDRIA